MGAGKRARWRRVVVGLAAALSTSAAADLPATLPVPVSPADGSTVATVRPVLVVENCDPADPLHPTCHTGGGALQYRFEVYRDADPGPTPTVAPDGVRLVPQDPGGQTAYDPLFDPGLPVSFEEDTWYFWRVQVTDGSATGAWTGFSSFLVDALPPAPDLAGPFGFCTDLVLTQGPGSVIIFDWHPPAGAVVTFDLQLYPSGTPPGIGPLLVDIQDFPQDPGGNPTEILLGGVSYLEDAHHTIRALRRVDALESPWTECSFWLDTTNSAPGPIAILSPTSGTSYPSDTISVTVTVQNASDAEGQIPGNQLAIALCASLDPSFGDCGPSPSNWQLEPSVADPARTTDLVVSQLIDGTLLGSDMHVFVQACALDSMDACGVVDTTDFIIDFIDPLFCDDIVCPEGTRCDPATWICEEVVGCPGGCPAEEFCDGLGTCQTDLCVGVTCESEEECDRSSGQCHPPLCPGGDCDGCTHCASAGSSPARATLAGLLLLGLFFTRRRI